MIARRWTYETVLALMKGFVAARWIDMFNGWMYGLVRAWVHVGHSWHECMRDSVG